MEKLKDKIWLNLINVKQCASLGLKIFQRSEVSTSTFFIDYTFDISNCKCYTTNWN